VDVHGTGYVRKATQVRCFHPVSYPEGSFPGIKWSGREADHSFPSSAEVRNE
jgi:hypothetical protein